MDFSLVQIEHHVASASAVPYQLSKQYANRTATRHASRKSDKSLNLHKFLATARVCAGAGRGSRRGGPRRGSADVTSCDGRLLTLRVTWGAGEPLARPGRAGQ
jgi:hypothetical protein